MSPEAAKALEDKIESAAERMTEAKAELGRVEEELREARYLLRLSQSPELAAAMDQMDDPDAGINGEDFLAQHPELA